MPPGPKILPNIIHTQTELEKIKKNIKKYKKDLKNYKETDLTTLLSLVRIAKRKYERLRKALQNYEDEDMRSTQIRKHFTRAEDETLNRVLRDMPQINVDLHNLKKDINKRIMSLQETVVDPLTKTELQSLTPIVPSSSTVGDSPTPLIDSLTPKAISQLSTVVDSLTPIAMSQLSTVMDPLTPSTTPIRMSQLSTVVEKDPEDINEEIKRRVIEGINKYFEKNFKKRKFKKRKGASKPNFEEFLKQFENDHRDGSPSPPPPNLPLRRKDAIEIDARDFLKKRTSPSPSSPPSKPKQKEQQQPQIGETWLMPIKSMQLPEQSYIRYISPPSSNSPPVIQLGGTRDLFQTLYAQSALLSAAMSSGQLRFSMGGNQFNFNGDSSFLQRQVNAFNNPTRFKVPSKPTPSLSTLEKALEPTPPPLSPPSPQPIETPRPIITPDRKDSSKVIITTPIPKPGSLKPVAVIVSRVKVTKEDKKRLREERQEREQREKERIEKRLREERQERERREKERIEKLLIKEKKIYEKQQEYKQMQEKIRKEKEQKEKEEKERRERAENRRRERMENERKRDEEIMKQMRLTIEMKLRQREKELQQFLPEPPSISNHSIKENSSVSTSMSLSNFSSNGGGAGNSASTTVDDDWDSIPSTQYSGGGSGGGSINNDLSIRTQGQGNFMDDVNRFISHNLNKSELFQPEPSKRNAENIDPLEQQAKIVPYWETNGLENIGVLPPSMTTSNGAFNKPVTTNPQKFVFMTYQSGINKFYNCKLPMKVNIPSGDFGIYKVTVNEVLFRTDMNLLDADDYIDFTFNDPIQIVTKDVDGNVNIIKKIRLPPLRISIASWLPNFQNLHINYLNIDTLIMALQYMIENNNQPIYEEDDKIIYLKHILVVEKQRLAGVGMFFKLVDYRYDTANNRYIRAHDCSFNISNCSTNFRHIFPPLQTTTALSSTKNTFFNFDGYGEDVMESYNSIYIPRCNFAGPQLILFNSSAQTTCPISNEYAKQFNTCALSYNTNEDTNSLIQMTSNVELTMKNTNEFRVWLTDNYGEPIKIQSPIYVQVTVQPFVNETSTAMNE